MDDESHIHDCWLFESDFDMREAEEDLLLHRIAYKILEIQLDMSGLVMRWQHLMALLWTPAAEYIFMLAYVKQATAPKTAGSVCPAKAVLFLACHRRLPPPA